MTTKLLDDFTIGDDGLPIPGKILEAFFNNDFGINNYNGSNCYSSNSLFGNTKTPPLLFYKQEKEDVTFGVEIEFHNLRNNIKKFTEDRRKKRKENTFFYFKGDGSLNSGVEVNTQPFSVGFYNSYGRAYISSLLEDVRNNDGKVDNGTGLHIHISRNIGDEAISRIATLVCSFKSEFEKLGGRGENQWCYFKSGDFDKYRAVANRISLPTIELRFMRSELEDEMVLGRIEMAFALVSFALSKKENTFDNFVSYIESKEGFTYFKQLLQCVKS